MVSKNFVNTTILEMVYLIFFPWFKPARSKSKEPQNLSQFFYICIVSEKSKTAYQ